MQSEAKYTIDLRQDLYKALVKRFGPFVKTELFLLSTYLDPCFGPNALPRDLSREARVRLTYRIKESTYESDSIRVEPNVPPKQAQKQVQRVNNYKNYGDDEADDFSV